jgi:hypothetical protein
VVPQFNKSKGRTSSLIKWPILGVLKLKTRKNGEEPMEKKGGWLVFIART